MKQEKYSLDFGKKEKVLNYATQTYQLSRPNKVGTVMALIPEWQSAFAQLTLQDCIDYIFNLTINRTFDGFLREKSVVNDGLAKIFPNVMFEESDPELDHTGDIDYIAKVGGKAFGIQIKPVTARANFGNYSPTERMKASFADFEDKFGGKVFVVFSLDGEISNKEIVKEIQSEIERLNHNALHTTDNSTIYTNNIKKIVLKNSNEKTPLTPLTAPLHSSPS
jgi:hypothetical protein